MTSDRTIFPMRNSIRNYAWGSYDGFSRYAGIPADPERPSAECWMGAHSGLPSLISLETDSYERLDSAIAEHQQEFLGPAVLSTWSGLPFLFKVLSASMPLSIQVHPSRSMAQAGFARENSQGIALSSPERMYKDENHKPELAMALSPFKALCGFRDAKEIFDLLGRHLSGFLSFPQDSGLESIPALLGNALSLKDRERSTLETLAKARAEELAGSSDPAAALAGETLRSCYRHYPHDSGAVMPLILRIHALEPGQGLYVPSGVMHSYLSGTILEIMASSDNVIRGGLTQKHVDVGELLSVIDVHASPAVVDSIPMKDGSLAWKTPAAEFELSMVELDGTAAYEAFPRGPEILFCPEGALTVEEPDAQHQSLEAGSSLFVAASCSGYRVFGKGKIYKARVGASSKPS